MKLARPFCDRNHPLAWMRLEREYDGCIPSWRCPECWYSEPMWEPERLDDLFVRLECAVIVSHLLVDEMRDWGPPVQVKFGEPDSELICEMFVREVA